MAITKSPSSMLDADRLTGGPQALFSQLRGTIRDYRGSAGLGHRSLFASPTITQPWLVAWQVGSGCFPGRSAEIWKPGQSRRHGTEPNPSCKPQGPTVPPGGRIPHFRESPTNPHNPELLPTISAGATICHPGRRQRKGRAGGWHPTDPRNDKGRQGYGPTKHRLDRGPLPERVLLAAASSHSQQSEQSVCAGRA